MENSSDSTEKKYSIIIFDNGEGKGWMSMHDVDYSPETADATLRTNFGPDARVITSLTGLTIQQISGINVILDNVEDIHIETRGDLEKLLRFSTATSEPKIVRKAVLDALPSLLRQFGDIQFLPAIERLFQLYLDLGDDPEEFEMAADREAAQMEPSRRSTCLVIFHIILQKIQPKIRGKIAEQN